VTLLSLVTPNLFFVRGHKGHKDRIILEYNNYPYLAFYWFTLMPFFTTMGETKIPRVGTKITRVRTIITRGGTMIIAVGFLKAQLII